MILNVFLELLNLVESFLAFLEFTCVYFVLYLADVNSKAFI